MDFIIFNYKSEKGTKSRSSLWVEERQSTAVEKMHEKRHKVGVICLGRQFLKGSPQLLDPTQSRTCSRQKHPWQKECRLIFIKYIPGIFHVLYIVTLWWFEVKKKKVIFFSSILRRFSPVWLFGASLRRPGYKSPFSTPRGRFPRSEKILWMLRVKKAM